MPGRERALRWIRGGYVVLSGECASVDCTSRDTRYNASSPVIFPRHLPTLTTTSLYYPRARPMSPMHSAPAAVDRELNERVSVVLLLDMQSVHENTIVPGLQRAVENPERL